jgi:Ca2+-binding RTX toxin-like protein
VLTLTSAGATATLAQWQAALASVTYTDGAASPTAGDRTISFTINDGAMDSATVTQTVHVTVDQPPELGVHSGVTDLATIAGVTPTPVAVAPVLTVSDADNATQASAAVSITGGFQAGEDVLAFHNDGATMGDIAGSFDAATGVLTLTSASATATLAQWQAALESVTYTNGAASPTAGDRTINFTINDGVADSESVTQTVHVTVDQPPVLGGVSGVTDLAIVAGVAPTPVAVAPAVTVSDPDNTTELSATVSITGGFHAGEDVLTFHNDGATMGDITGSYDAANGVLTLTSALTGTSGGTATLVQWQAALQSVTYTDSAADPTAGDRTISFTINDGAALYSPIYNDSDSAAVTQTVHVTVDHPPILGGLSGVTNLPTLAGATPTPVAVAPALTVSDIDNTTQASATVSITGGFHSGEDLLAFHNDGATMGDIAASFDAATGVLTLTSAGGTATLAQWQAALESVTYTDGAASPTLGDRTISFTINDGLADSATVTQTVHVSIDQPPELGVRSDVTNLATVVGVTPTPVVVAPVVTLWDADNATQASATVSITDGFHAGEDVLAFHNDGATMGDIAGSFDAATGVLTLTSAGGTATLAQWQAALESVTYADGAASPTAGDRTISFTINDGVTDSEAVTQTVHVTVDQPPTLDGLSGVTDLAIVAGAPATPVAVAPTVTVSDADNTTELSATVSITGGFRPGEDVLAFHNDGATMGDITGSYDAANGVLTLTSAVTPTSVGAATLAEWQAALASVTYTDSAATPTAGDRTISFTINDGAALYSPNYADSDSATVTQTVHVTVTSSPPHGGGGGAGGGYVPPKRTFVFETMTSDDAASYNAGSDHIIFSNPDAHATAIQVVFTPSATTPGTVSSAVITDLTTGHSVTFGALIMGEDDFVFSDSSKLVVGTAGADATLTNLATFTGGVAMFGSFGDDVLKAGAGQAVLQGNQGDDTLVAGAGSDTLFGGQGSDFIDASRSTGHNLVNGNLGDDTLISGSGGDTLRGGQGDDVIHGGSGHDWLSGDRGANTLTGGAGPDTFHAGLGNDVVTDFNAADGDRVQLDLGTVYTASQVGADVEIDLTGGGRMVLQNVQLSTLPPGWIFEA